MKKTTFPSVVGEIDAASIERFSWAAQKLGPPMAVKMTTEGASPQEIFQVLDRLLEDKVIEDVDAPFDPGAPKGLDQSIRALMGIDEDAKESDPQCGQPARSLMWIAADAKNWDAALALAQRGAIKDAGAVALMAVKEDNGVFLEKFLAAVQQEVEQKGSSASVVGADVASYDLPFSAVEVVGAAGQSLTTASMRQGPHGSSKCFEAALSSFEDHWIKVFSSLPETASEAFAGGAFGEEANGPIAAEVYSRLLEYDYLIKGNSPEGDMEEKLAESFNKIMAMAMKADSHYAPDPGAAVSPPARETASSAAELKLGE